jgi:tRNA(fMet)-specific endonuclease VapC
MLDTNICSFIMRERPSEVLEKLSHAVHARHRIVVSAITYSELRFGSIAPKASPKIPGMVDAFVQRREGVLPWDTSAIDWTAKIRAELGRLGSPIGNNDAAIAGHALATGCVLVSNNMREFERVRTFGLTVIDWAI